MTILQCFSCGPQQRPVQMKLPNTEIHRDLVKDFARLLSGFFMFTKNILNRATEKNMVLLELPLLNKFEMKMGAISLVNCFMLLTDQRMANNSRK